MPVTIDITKALLYKQGKEEGREEGIDIGAEQSTERAAEKMFMNGMDISLIQNITGLSMSKLKEIARRVAASQK